MLNSGCSEADMTHWKMNQKTLLAQSIYETASSVCLKIKQQHIAVWH
jgi:hypothetical protein